MPPPNPRPGRLLTRTKLGTGPGNLCLQTPGGMTRYELLSKSLLQHTFCCQGHAQLGQGPVSKVKLQGLIELRDSKCMRIADNLVLQLIHSPRELPHLATRQLEDGVVRLSLYLSPCKFSCKSRAHVPDCYRWRCTRHCDYNEHSCDAQVGVHVQYFELTLPVSDKLISATSTA